MTRRWCCALLLVVLASPAILTLTHVRSHDCIDHVCSCGRRADSPRESPAPTCHGSPGDRANRCEMRARCAHETPLLSTDRLYLPPHTLSEAVSLTAETLPAARVSRPRPGVLRIDSPPPRHS